MNEIKPSLTEEEREKLRKEARKRVAEIVPQPQGEAKEIWEQLLTHVLMVHEINRQGQSSS